MATSFLGGNSYELCTGKKKKGDLDPKKDAFSEEAQKNPLGEKRTSKGDF